ncbi:MAG: ribonuclease HI family protein [Chloroflexi bacterium]|nr:MAG: ribonuclease HI family protein [Chloroflexota bacterium]
MPYVLQADGAARGNPGPAGAGAVLYAPDGSVVAELRKPLGTATNNRAEYEALVIGLEEARRRDIEDLVIRLDSELLVKQMRGEYRIRSEALRPLAQRAIRLIAELGARIEHVPRERNAHADRLANEAIDRGA